MATAAHETSSNIGLFNAGNVFDETSDNDDVEMTTGEDNGLEECTPMETNTGPTLDTNGSASNTTESERLIIAVDFGTTFSSIAFVHLERGATARDITLDRVQCIGEFPGYHSPGGVSYERFDVPTELWYDPGGRQSYQDFTTREPHHGRDHDSSGGDSAGSDSDEDESEYDEDRIVETIESGGRADQAVRPGTQFWGFAVQEQLSHRDIPKKEARPLSRFKLMLDEKRETEQVRDGLKPVLRALKSRKFVKHETDIFKHYLTHLLKHAKQQLEYSELLRQDVAVEFVLCVPAKWPAKGCRIMQAAMNTAVQEAGFGEQASHSISNLFMISEPEAAAACVLEEGDNEVYYGETVVILDAGGGTVDAVTYQCTHHDPVRLSAEVVAPDSKLCGASYINQRFEKKLLEKLENETYLVKNGKTIKSIVETKTAEFEINQKRRIDTTKRNAVIAPIYIDDLRQDISRNFYQNRVAFTHKEMEGIFKPSLKGSWGVLKSQLELAKSAGHKVEKVILTGGFGQSRALQNYLKKKLKEQDNFAGAKIDLVVPENPSTAVARGAVLRALNKEHGPSRITQCSYGYLCSEPYEPEVYSEHKQTKCRINKADGEKWVDGIINWFIKPGETLKNSEEFAIHVKHTFSLKVKSLLCEEVLYVSDKQHQSHYRKTHAVNKGAERAGSIIADMTFLRDEGLIQPELPSQFSTYSGTDKRYWAVEFELAMIVEGRSLRFEARWPLRKDLQLGQEQMVRVKGQVCIAAGFQPGTE